MKYLIILGFAFSILLPSVGLTDDNEDENAIYSYRMDVMENSSKHLKALRRYVKGALPIEGHVQAHVDALLALNSMYQDLFPAGQQHPESLAKPMIWSDPRGFQQAIQYNRQRIMAIKQIDASDIDKLKRAVNEVRMSCGDCHYYFKEK